MFYRNPYINKLKGAIWSDKSNASTILNNEFFGVESVPTSGWGKLKVAGVFVDMLGRKIKVSGAFVDSTGYKVKVGGTFVDVA